MWDFLWQSFIGYLVINGVLAGSGGLVCLAAWALIEINGGEW